MKTKLKIDWKSLGALVVGVACLAFVGAATAATDTDNMTVTATVGGSCSVTAPAGGLAFGIYDPVVANASAPLNAQANITVQCTDGTAGVIGIDNGANFSSPNRRMEGDSSVDAEFLNYALYSNAARDAAWLNAAPDTVTHNGTGTATAITVYGQIPAGQTGAAKDSYTDTVVVTITFTP